MVVKYLDKIYQELYQQKISLESDILKRKHLLEENKRFIQTLEYSLDENYELFFPRKINEESHKKIESLLEEQKELEESIKYNQEKIDCLKSQISELQLVLQTAQKNEETIASQNTILTSARKDTMVHEHESTDRELYDNVKESLIRILRKIELCDKLEEVDPVRCKLELKEMRKGVKDIIESMNG